MKSGLTIEEQVLEVIRTVLFGIKITLNSVVLNGSGIDREFQRDLIMMLEEEMEIEIPDTDAEKLVTVKDVVDYVTKKKTPTEPKKVEPKKEEPKIIDVKLKDKKSKKE